MKSRIYIAAISLFMLCSMSTVWAAKSDML